jgi:lipid II:glycine glycyltransferase (peptidoglycan interpeptide bridge formation enzyme)
VIKVLPNTEIDKSRWDKCLESTPYSSVFSLSWYLDAVHESWHGMIHGDYENVIPLCESNRLGTKALIQPVFSRYTVFDFSNAALQQHYNEYIHSQYGRIALCFPVQSEGFSGNFSLRYYQQLDLNKTQEELTKSYSTNVRRILKRASVQVVEDADFSRTIRLFESVKSHELGVKKTQLHRLEKLMDNAVKNNCGEALHVFNSKGECIASAFFLKFKNRITYLKGASSAEGKACGAMHHIMHKQITNYLGGEYVLDFGGSNVASVAQFFKKFGAIDVPYYLYSHGEEPLHIRVLKKLLKK